MGGGGFSGEPPSLIAMEGSEGERAPAVLNDLPFILDDTKHSTNPEEITRTVYSIAQGRGRGRGTIKGTARQDTFRTVMLSSGEQPILSFTEDGGTRARVIQVWGSPFGGTSPDLGPMVRDLNARLKDHYGYAGPLFISFILIHRKRWPAWRKWYAKWVARWEDEAGPNPIAGRMASHFAVLSITAVLAHCALDLPWEREDPVEILWNELIQDARDRTAAAHRHQPCGRENGRK